MKNGTVYKPRHAHLAYEECERRYPRLIRLVQWVLVGSSSEAALVIRDYRDGLPFSCEACSHSGLTPQDRIRSAVAARHTLRSIWGGRYLRNAE